MDPNELRKLADELEQKSGDRFIVVLDRGWIFVGNLSEIDDDHFVLSNAKNVRKWEKGGFGLLSQSAKQAGAILDDCADIHFSSSAKILYIPVTEKWDE